MERIDALPLNSLTPGSLATQKIHSQIDFPRNDLLIPAVLHNYAEELVEKRFFR